MKQNLNDWDRRNQYIHLQKASFMSVKPQQYGHVHRQIRGSEKRELFMPRDSEERSFTNLFSDSQDNNNDSKKLQNSPSSGQLRSKGLMFHGKQVRESENIPYENDSLKVASITKSISQKQLTPKTVLFWEKPDLLRLKSENSLLRNQDSEQVKALMRQVKQSENENEKIKQQNIQLRLKKMKLSSDSESMRILAIKMQIQEYKKKIEKLKSQNGESHTTPTKLHDNSDQYYNMSTNSAQTRRLGDNNLGIYTSNTGYPNTAQSSARFKSSNIKPSEKVAKNIFNNKASQIYHHPHHNQQSDTLVIGSKK